jgi:hypothetical protein
LPLQVSVEQFGARADSESDATQAIQEAIAAVERNGGGTVVIPGRYRCGNIIISRRGVRLEGRGGVLVNGRLSIASTAERIEIAELSLLDTTGDRQTYLVDISGRDCRFRNVELTKRPSAGGYHMYLRQTSAGCSFDGLRLHGSNGIMVAGTNHRFENFEFESAAVETGGGDDAFAVKGLEAATEDIVIRNGVVRGYTAVISFGSEVGRQHPSRGAGVIRRVTVDNVNAERCGGLAFFKPGALDYDWRDGVVEAIRLHSLTLRDPSGAQFRSGIRMIAARGAIIRDVRASAIRIVARARDRGVAPTAAVDITLLDRGAAARIQDVRIQLAFSDPFGGARHSKLAPGYPVDQIVRIEKVVAERGSMAGITLDVEGLGASFAGIYIGGGLDGAVNVKRAVLRRVATDPPATHGGGGIWSDSLVETGALSIESMKLPRFGGKGFHKRGG